MEFILNKIQTVFFEANTALNDRRSGSSISAKTINIIEQQTDLD